MKSYVMKKLAKYQFELNNLSTKYDKVKLKDAPLDIGALGNSCRMNFLV